MNGKCGFNSIFLSTPNVKGYSSSQIFYAGILQDSLELVLNIFKPWPGVIAFWSQSPNFMKLGILMSSLGPR